MGKAFPYDEGEDGEADGAHGGAGGIDARGFSSSQDASAFLRAVAVLPLFFFLLVPGEEGSGGGEDGGEG